MPPKAKASSKAAPNPDPKAAPEQSPETVGERSQLRFFQTNPVEKRRQEVGIPGLTPSEKKTYTHTNLILPVITRRVALSNRTEREYWKSVAKEGLPIRRLPKSYNWGKDKNGQDLATYKLEEFEQRSLKHARLTALDILHRQFLSKRDIAQRQGNDLPEEDIEEERKRRQVMANLKRDLYGEFTGSLAKDPLWDDVIPIPQDEPEGALAQIAYPDDYAEVISYLRAVMAAEEYSSRAFRLTDTVIQMNPAHYTVWLYRFKILSALKLSVEVEISWLNEVALANLKNYQIWNHRQAIMDYYYPQVKDDEAQVKDLVQNESKFLATILAEDTKNYHVWSYRQYLVQKFGVFTHNELGSTQNLIEDDPRNNSAWSHRFYLVFSDPSASTPDSGAGDYDPKIPDQTLDREINYAKEKIELAPQNQSPWNYLQGVLTKGGRKPSTIQDFAEQFVSNLGEDSEEVKSSHALDLLATIYAEAGDKDKARLCLRRLSEKWDPIREGYWKYRATLLDCA